MKVMVHRRSPRLHKRSAETEEITDENKDGNTSAGVVIALKAHGGDDDMATRVKNSDIQITREESNDPSIVEGEGRKDGVDGASYKTAIVLSPTPDVHTPNPIATRGKEKLGGAFEAGQSASKAIILSPTVRAEGNLGRTVVRERLLASLLRTPSPHGVLPNANQPWNLDASPFMVSSELQRIVAELSAAVKEKDHAKKGKDVAVDLPCGTSRTRNTCPGMFTPPTFHLLSQSSSSSADYDYMNVDSSPDRDDVGQGTSAPIYAPPLAWAQITGMNHLIYNALYNTGCVCMIRFLLRFFVRLFVCFPMYN